MKHPIEDAVFPGVEGDSWGVKQGGGGGRKVLSLLGRTKIWGFSRLAYVKT